jgi:hypothetical protein
LIPTSQAAQTVRSYAVWANNEGQSCFLKNREKASLAPVLWHQFFNMLWRPGIAVSNGRERLTSGPDSWGRVVAQVPPHVWLLDFRLTPAWKTGYFAGMLCLFCAALSSIFVTRARV